MLLNKTKCILFRDWILLLATNSTSQARGPTRGYNGALFSAVNAICSRYGYSYFVWRSRGDSRYQYLAMAVQVAPRLKKSPGKATVATMREADAKLNLVAQLLLTPDHHDHHFRPLLLPFIFSSFCHCALRTFATSGCRFLFCPAELAVFSLLHSSFCPNLFLPMRHLY